MVAFFGDRFAGCNKNNAMRKTKNSNKYISLEEFLAIAHVKERTFRKRISEIKGIHMNGKEILIEEGTRYPLPKRYKANLLGQKYYLILKSTAIPRFIDHYFLGVTEKEFDKMLNDLVKAGLLWKNGLTNIYGANQYSLTMKGEEALVKQKREAIAWITDIVSKAAGNIVSAFIKRV